ncbi:MAG: SusC/RagA family TonB-linked outer membrane protein [Bacteroidetes bacterium]|jgi:TonB-linked SusC/RagA family outer membrane protein|nr:SusC/RagA family TonB-linked outer membrane protein [Bacteroidota bacterium]
MKKTLIKNTIWTLMFIISMQFQAFSQDRVLNGLVTDDQDNPIKGAVVTLKGTKSVKITDEQGKFTFKVNGSNLSFTITHVQFESKEFTWNGEEKPVYKLSNSVSVLNNVVVTALGFEAKKDKLGYTTAKVTSEAVSNSGETGLVDALAGKASGVIVSRTSGDPGAASKILLRGQSTITRSTDPLIIIDGVPIAGDARNETNGGTTQQSRLNDINPDDIANVQILKGASAAALWGTRAANGVIVITTKKGSVGKVNITFSSTYSIDKVSDFFSLQDVYGQGLDGKWVANQTRSWGDKIALRAGGDDIVNTTGAYFVGNTGKTYYPIVTKNSKETFLKKNYDQVIGDGAYLENNISVSGADAKSNYYLSLNNLDQRGILKSGSTYKRTSFRLNASRELSNWLSISNKFTYTNSYSDRVQTGVNNAGLMIALVRNPADFDNADYIGSYYAAPGGAATTDRQRSYRNYIGASANPGFNNPFWVINNSKNNSEVNRFIDAVEAKIKLAKWFSVINRVGLDYFTDRQINYFPYYTANANTGSYTREEYNQYQLNYDLIAQIEKEITSKIEGNILFGYNNNIYKSSVVGATTLNFILPNGPSDFDNATPTNITTVDNFITRLTNAGYTSMGLGFNDQLFWNATGRLEAASTFGELAPKTFFYPSTDLAWQFTKLKYFENSSFISFGKLRASYGVVGVQPTPYNTSTIYSSRTFQDGLGGYLDPALYGTGTYMQSVNKGNAYLMPERKEEIEFGIDMRFLDNKITLGVTRYNNKTTDALINIPQSPSAGFNTSYANAGIIENKGWEADLSFTAYKKKDLEIGIYGTFTKNKNQVVSLNGVESINLGGTSGISSRAVKGFALGELYSIKFQRNANGGYLLDANGFPIPGLTAEAIGDPNPDWRGSTGINIKYKNFKLNALVEHSQGGVIANGTEAVLLDYGTSAATQFESVSTKDLKRYDGTIITANTPFRGNIKDFGGGAVALDQKWYTGPGGWFGNVGEQYLEDASWTRFRELNLSYLINGRNWKYFGFKSLEITLSGRNLFLISNVKGFDPDSNVNGSTSARGVNYFVNPPTKSYLFSIKVNF